MRQVFSIILVFLLGWMAQNFLTLKSFVLHLDAVAKSIVILGNVLGRVVLESNGSHSIKGK